MTADHDRIDLSIDVHTDLSTAWALISEPGWFINDGELTAHDVTWDENTATVVDPDHGQFRFVRETSDQPHHLSDRGLIDGTDASRRVEFWLSEEGDSVVRVRVVESGFASLPVPAEEQRAQHAQNTTTWQHQLQLVQSHLEPPSERPADGQG